jgi:hypothetical protein
MLDWDWVYVSCTMIFELNFLPSLQLGVEHRTCVVDGLARAGVFDEAVADARALQNSTLHG